MDRSGLVEIRKLFTYKEGEGAAGNFAGCFINADKEIKGRFMDKMYSIEKNTIHKFYDIYKKTLANSDADVGISSDDFEDGGIGFLLDKIRATELNNGDILEILYEKLRDSLPENNYVVTLIYYVYDIPVKTSDKRKIDDAGEGIFKFILCSVCPVKTSKGTLGYLPDIDKIGENPQLLTVDKPAFGFMYPSFNDREADTGNILCYRTKDLDISAEVFAHQAPELVVEEKPKKNAVGKRSLADPDDEDLDSRADESAVVRIGSVSSGMSQYGSQNAEIPSLDTGTLSNDAHYVRERLIDDEIEEKDYSREPSDNELIASSGYTMPAPEKKKRRKPVSILGDVSRVKKKEIDGVVCYVIEVDDASLN